MPGGHLSCGSECQNLDRTDPVLGSRVDLSQTRATYEKNAPLCSKHDSFHILDSVGALSEYDPSTS